MDGRTDGWTDRRDIGNSILDQYELASFSQELFHATLASPSVLT